MTQSIRMAPQTARVFKYLKQEGPLTPMVAWGVLRVPRLAARIHELRSLGFAVTTEPCIDCMGGKYARYKLAS